ncbi:unnamed protein product [Bathycoccus prasinos]
MRWYYLFQFYVLCLFYGMSPYGGILILDLRVLDGTVQGLKQLERAGFECGIYRPRRRGKTVRCVKT